MNASIISKEQSKAYVSALNSQSAISQEFDFTRRFTCTKSSTGTVEIPIGNNADFELKGYNIEFDAGTAGAINVLSLLFSQELGNRFWSNDKLPIASIATPGVRNVTNPVPRYGYRFFPGFVPGNDKIKIDWENSDAAADIEVVVTFHGILWFR